jgi:hypothetical protein
MKKLVLMAMAAVLAAPAFVAVPAFARTPERHVEHRAAVQAQSPTVVYGGHVVGQDPDPNVRLSILRDAEVGFE